MKYIYINATMIVLMLVSINSYAQLGSNGKTTATILNENPFLDASTNDFGGANKGVGLIFPRVNLTTFTFITSSLDGITFPTAFDGMVVYNTGTGNTVTGNGSVVSVTPGFYYFSNPTGTNSITNGKWIALGSNSGSSGSTISVKSTNYVITKDDETILVDASSANVTISLPNTLSTGKKITIKKNDNSENFKVIVTGVSTTIEGLPSIETSVPYQGWVFQYTGTRWSIINNI